MGIEIDLDGRLLCPVCGFEYTHVDKVAIAFRKEDELADHLSVDAITGYVDRTEEATPAGPKVGQGRRHRIVLLGDCENGHRFALAFSQHKGITFVEALRQDWTPI